MVTPEHRRLLSRIAQAPLTSQDWFDKLRQRVSDGAVDYQQLWEGRVRFTDLGIEPPAEYRDYLALGRFRNALILDAIAQKTNSGLEKFAAAYRIEYYQPE
jgi:hypothetical protein